MPDIKIYPAVPCGILDAPPSKSAAHRALICASLANGHSRVTPLSNSADMEATIQVLSAMGAQIKREGSTASICGIGGQVESPSPVLKLNCKESGSTFRFLLPVAAALGCNAVFSGEGRLPERPVSILMEQLASHGISFSGEQMPFSISGNLTGGTFSLPGDVSSQFISGLLFALPLVAQDSEIILTSPLQSADYVQMTLAALSESGIFVERTETGWAIPGRQAYQSNDRCVEGDWSNAAFWLCAGAISGDGKLGVRGLDDGSAQGDRIITDIIRRFSGDFFVMDVTFSNGSCQDNDILSAFRPSGNLIGQRIDAGPIPDLVPIISVMGAFAEGKTEIYNAARLRIKESDRLATVTALLRGLGGQVEEYPDRLVIHGGGLRGGVADGANDHRIVMAAAIAGLFCKEPVTIRGVQAVNKSYPNFFDELQKLGGRFDVV